MNKPKVLESIKMLHSDFLFLQSQTHIIKSIVHAQIKIPALLAWDANGIHYFSDIFIKNVYIYVVSFSSINIFLYPGLCFSGPCFDWWVSRGLRLEGKPVTIELPELLCLTNNVSWHLQAFWFCPGGEKNPNRGAHSPAVRSHTSVTSPANIFTKTLAVPDVLQSTLTFPFPL